MSVTVLVVDDTDHVRTMLVEMLQLDGFAVLGQAHDGEEAIALATEMHPDVVIMDLRMPGMDGLEATRQICAAIPDQSVILYTAFVDADVRRDAEAAGAVRCLGKVEGLATLERELDRISLAIDA